MKHHRRTRSHTEQTTALRNFSSRNQPSLAPRVSNRSRYKSVLADLARPIEAIVGTFPLEGFPAVVICEDGTVMRRPIVTVVMDKHTRSILSWHMS
jgi:hypothetical protein